MSKDKKPMFDGYQPEIIKKGYQPSMPSPMPTRDPKPQGGYIPTTSDGSNPANIPIPPGDE